MDSLFWEEVNMMERHKVMSDQWAVD